MNWKLKGVKKDNQSVSSDWQMIKDTINGVIVKEIKNVLKNDGHVTEIWRKDWKLDEDPVSQVFQVTLNPNKVNGWHSHADTHDRLMVNTGNIKIVLYDARPESPTYKMINEYRFGSLRPALVVVPPKVYHAIENLENTPSTIINIVSHAYIYNDPDHWRIPITSKEIPYSFK